MEEGSRILPVSSNIHHAAFLFFVEIEQRGFNEFFNFIINKEDFFFPFNLVSVYKVARIESCMPILGSSKSPDTLLSNDNNTTPVDRPLEAGNLSFRECLLSSQKTHPYIIGSSFDLLI